MAKSNRIFTSFAIEDQAYRNLLVGQARHEKSPFEFVDMSVKEPWDSQWKTNCRSKIRGCDGVIALLSSSTPAATGQLWEIACAREEGIPVRGVYVSDSDRPASTPKELVGVRIVTWTWESIASFIDSL
ncbi:MAG: hypothetical protein AABZ53_06690 [Planctomycetota bacterium]